MFIDAVDSGCRKLAGFVGVFDIYVERWPDPPVLSSILWSVLFEENGWDARVGEALIATEGDQPDLNRSRLVLVASSKLKHLKDVPSSSGGPRIFA